MHRRTPPHPPTAGVLLYILFLAFPLLYVVGFVAATWYYGVRT
jgi:hypothetical protein